MYLYQYANTHYYRTRHNEPSATHPQHRVFHLNGCKNGQMENTAQQKSTKVNACANCAIKPSSHAALQHTDESFKGHPERITKTISKEACLAFPEAQIFVKVKSGSEPKGIFNQQAELEKAVLTISEAKKHFLSSIDIKVEDLIANNESSDHLIPLRDVRLKIWDSLKVKADLCTKLQDLHKLMQAIEFHIAVDKLLIKEEFFLYTDDGFPIKSNLFILKRIQDQMQTGRIDLRIGLLLRETFETLEMKENKLFINEIKDLALFFKNHDYPTIFTHCELLIEEFENIDLEFRNHRINIDKYIANWNARLLEFDSIQLLLLNLKEAETDYQTCIREIARDLPQIEAAQDDTRYQKLGSLLNDVMDSTNRGNLTNANEIELHTKQLINFTAKVHETL